LYVGGVLAGIGPPFTLADERYRAHDAAFAALRRPIVGWSAPTNKRARSSSTP